jgi:DNA-directed RNA polymerase specialized sigma24 family protein
MRTKLAARATELSRRIYASLPWGYRLARLFMKLSDASEFGPAFYAEFIHRGVSGMDEIDGKDPSTFKGDKNLANLLGRKKYGRNFGQKLFATALRKLKSAEIVEDAITDYFIKLKTGKGMGRNIDEGTPLSTAEGYAITGVIRTGFDILKKKKRERPSLVRRDESGTERQIDINDPAAFKEFASIMTVMDLEKAMRDVERFDERAAFWIKQMMRGWKDKEIAKELGFKHPQQLYELKKKYWGPKLRKIFEKYQRQAM